MPAPRFVSYSDGELLEVAPGRWRTARRGGPVGAHPIYIRAATGNIYRPPFVFSGIFQVRDRLDDVWIESEGRAPTWDWAVNFQVHQSNSQNVFVGLGGKTTKSIATQVEYDWYRPAEHWAFRTRTPNRWLVDNQSHRFEFHVLEWGHYKFFLDGELVAEGREKQTPFSGLTGVGLRLDFFDVELWDLDVRQMGFRVDPKVILEAALRRDRVYPYAVWAPIPESNIQPNIRPTTFIMHSMAGPRLTSLEALRAYVARDDVHIEPTFVGPDFDGRVFQVVYVDQRADCNAKANAFAVSCETQDAGSGSLPTTPWSDAQVEQLAGILAFIHLRDGVPLREATTWNGGGVGGHAKFAEWSVYVGKTCPGAARFAQIPDVINRAKEIVAAAKLPQPEPEEDVKPIIWRDERYNDAYQVFPAVSPLDQKLAAELRSRGAVDLVGRHRRQLKALATMCGQTSVTQTDGKIVLVSDIPDVGN